jgi:DNA polymerase-3 subunit epsilon
VFAVLDVETTGLSPRGDRVLELAVVRLDERGAVVDEWSSRFNPQGPVGATHIHGITEADVRDAPLFADKLAEISSRLTGTVLIAHNAPFDTSFLRSEFERAGWRWPDVASLCTMKASWHYSPHLSRRRLADCCADEGVPLHDAHSALGDARATAGLLSSWLGRHPVHPGIDPALAKRVAVAWPTAASALPTQRWAPTATSRRTGTEAPRRTPPKPKAPALGSMLHQVKFGIGPMEDPLPVEDRIAVESYLEKLTEAVADGVLTDDEVSHLADLAEVYELDPETVTNAHRVIIEGVTQMAMLDSKISNAERAEIRHLAAQLGVSDKDLKTLLAEQRVARLQILSEDLPPLPDGWALGGPVRVGDKVAFTGGDPAARAKLEALAAQVGVEVMASVSKGTAFLVSDGLQSTKSRAAEEHGVRVVTYRDFLEILRWRQPAIGQRDPEVGRSESLTSPA